jgi:nicotinamide riboside kinase
MQLADHFQAQGKSVSYVPEYLRTWCDENGRTPRQDEQLRIATVQAGHISAAFALGCDYTITDTTPLMVAVYSDLLFSDISLYSMVLSMQSSFDITLLMGLDIPWVADGIQRDGPHMQAPVDAKIRAALDKSSIRYHVIYGFDQARLDHALLSVQTANSTAASNAKESKSIAEKPEKSKAQRLRNWTCERCSDPECEHKLFRDLLNKSSTIV